MVSIHDDRITTREDLPDYICAHPGVVDSGGGGWEGSGLRYASGEEASRGREGGDKNDDHYDRLETGEHAIVRIVHVHPAADLRGLRFPLFSPNSVRC